MISDHEHNWDHWGLVGVTCFGLPQKRNCLGRSPQKKVPRDWLDGWRALGSVVSHGLLMSAMGPGGCHVVHGFHGFGSDRGLGGFNALGSVVSHVPWSAGGCRVIRARGLPWSPVISDRGWEGLGRLGP